MPTFSTCAITDIEPHQATCRHRVEPSVSGVTADWVNKLCYVFLHIKHSQFNVKRLFWSIWRPRPHLSGLASCSAVCADYGHISSTPLWQMGDQRGRGVHLQFPPCLFCYVTPNLELTTGLMTESTETWAGLWEPVGELWGRSCHQFVNLFLNN